MFFAATALACAFVLCFGFLIYVVLTNYPRDDDHND